MAGRRLENRVENDSDNEVQNSNAKVLVETDLK